MSRLLHPSAKDVVESNLALKYLSGCDSLKWINHQHFKYKWARALRYFAWHTKRALRYLSVELSIRCSFKWEKSMHKSKQKHSKCPHISSRPIVLSLHHYFRSHITRRPTKHPHLLFWNTGKSKINNLHWFHLIHHKILQFQVSKAKSLTHLWAIFLSWQ